MDYCSRLGTVYWVVLAYGYTENHQDIKASSGLVFLAYEMAYPVYESLLEV